MFPVDASTVLFLRCDFEFSAYRVKVAVYAHVDLLLWSCILLLVLQYIVDISSLLIYYVQFLRQV